MTAGYDPAVVDAGRAAANQLPPLSADVAARVSALLSLPTPTEQQEVA